MRVAVLSSHTPSLFWFRMDMMKAFISEGHEVIAIGNEPEELWESQFAEKGIRYIQIKVQRNGVNPVKDLRTLFSIRKVLREVKPDKIFTYQAKTVIYGGIAANLLGIKEVYPLIAGVGSVFLSNTLKAKVIRTVLNVEYRFAMRKCPAIFFQNNDDVTIFKSNKILNEQKIVLLHGSGVNLEYFEKQPLPDHFAFLCISRLIRDKGVFEYLEACKRVKQKYPQINCILVGPYDSNPTALLPEDIKPYIEQGIIEFYGEQTDVRPFLAKCTVFVLPSYREGTPKTVLEAMASGRAVITTDTPGCKETVEEGKNGFLVPIKDIDTLYEKMIYLVENLDLVKCMAEYGREKAEDFFDVKLVNKSICEAMGL